MKLSPRNKHLEIVVLAQESSAIFDNSTGATWFQESSNVGDLRAFTVSGDVGSSDSGGSSDDDGVFSKLLEII